MSRTSNSHNLNIEGIPSSNDSDRLLESTIDNEGACKQQILVGDAEEDSSIKSSDKKNDYLTALPSFVRGYLGSGLLALPYVFYQAGIFWGIILTAVCCTANHYLMKLIALTCDDCGVSRNAWGNMCKAVGGKKFKLVAEVSLLFSQFGTCIGESMFALKFLNYTFCALSINAVCNQYYQHVLMILIVIIPLTAVTNMRNLSLPNEIADFATLAFIIVTVGLGISQLGSLGALFGNFGQAFFSVKFDGTILFCSTLLYAIGGVGAILDVRNSMNNKQVFYSVLRGGFIVIGLNFGFFGAFNSLVSLDNTQEIYLYNLPATKISLTVQIVYLFTTTMTYITNQFPVMTILESWIDPDNNYFHADKTDGGTKMKAIRYSTRYLLVAVIITIAYVVPSFTLFLSFVGSYNFAVMNGLIPVLAYNTRFKGRISKSTLIVNCTLLSICVALGGLGMYESISKMITASS